MSSIAERPNMSLFGIETQLIELLQFREDLLADPELQGAEREESLQATEERIREYVAAEVKKVDGIARYMRECEARARIAKDEAERIKARQRMWESRYEKLKTITESVMIQTGQRKLEGQGNTLSLRKCPPSVEIAQEGLVPPEYRQVTVTMSQALWDEVYEEMKGRTNLGTEARIKFDGASKSKIGEALKRGDGVPGCSLVSEKMYLKLS